MPAVGRPKEFDRDEALEKAMELFWIQGYEGTGLRDLLQHMGIGRQSLYDTFGDKRSLFVEAVKHYDRRVTQRIVCLLSGGGSPLQRVREAFASIASSVGDGKCRGCLLTNTVVETGGHDREITELARSILKRIETAFRQVLEEAVAGGEISADTNVRALGRYLTSTMQGLVVMGKASVSRATIQDILSVALSVLDRSS